MKRIFAAVMAVSFIAFFPACDTGTGGDPAKAKDRPLADFAGMWQSGTLFLDDASLGTFISQYAAGIGKTDAEVKSMLQAAWETDYEHIAIGNNTLFITEGSETRSALYAYRGYEIVESDAGTSVWYKYGRAGEDTGFPAFIMLNDHGDGDEEEHHGEEEHEEVPHIHLKYGSESFAALVERAGWSPMYFIASADAAQIVETLAGE